MPLDVKVRSFLRNVFSGLRADAELDKEVRAHLELLIDEKIRAGRPPEEAMRAARMELGGIEQVKEEVREVRMGNWLRSVMSDCRYGLRQFRERPGVTAIMIFTLALALGPLPQFSAWCMGCCCVRCLTRTPAGSLRCTKLIRTEHGRGWLIRTLTTSASKATVFRR